MTLEKLRELTTVWYSGQKYGSLPYTKHLDDGRAVLTRFGFGQDELDGDPSNFTSSFAYLHEAFELHDLFEDTDITPGYVLTQGVSWNAVKIALLVTDQPGKDRAERKAKSYPIIASEYGSIIVKLADRIANVQRGGKMDMYRKEQPAFEAALRNKISKESHVYKRVENMWNHLNALYTVERAWSQINENNWCKGRLAKNNDGTPVHYANLTTADRCCAVGWISRVYGQNRTCEVYDNVLKRVYDVLESIHGQKSIGEFNDDPKTTVMMVKDILQLANA